MDEDFRTKLKAAKRRRRTVSVVLRGDLAEQHERLERDLLAAEIAESNGTTTTSIEDVRPTVRIAREMAAVAEQMREHSHTFVLEALPGPRYRKLKAEHPPRRDDDGNLLDEDRQFDVNVDAFALPLLRASLIDPDLTDAEWAEVDEQLSDGQYNQLVNAALMVNKGDVDIPFSLAASRRLASTATE